MKNKLTLRMNDSEQPVKKDAGKAKTNTKSKKKDPNKPSVWKRIAKFFREIWSELKKVDWPHMTKTKNNPGVLQNTGIVLVVVLFFLVVITAFDMGLTELLNLLRQIQK